MWLDGALHFSTGLDEQKGRNLLHNTNCANRAYPLRGRALAIAWSTGVRLPARRHGRNHSELTDSRAGWRLHVLRLMSVSDVCLSDAVR
jgi:hypothetical protein